MWLLYILQTLIFTYVSFLLGKSILQTCGWRGNTTLHGVLAITLGYGGIAIIGLILALCGWLNAAWLYTIGAIILITSYKTVLYHLITWTSKEYWKRTAKTIWKSLRAQPIPFVLIALWVVGYVAISLSPTAMGKDGLAYHLPFAVEIGQSHHISFPVMGDPEYGQLPLLGELMDAVTLTLFNNLGVLKLLQLVTYLLLVVGLISLVRKYVSDQRIMYLLLALLLACTPLARNALSGAMVDSWTFLFGIMSLYVLIDCLIKNEKGRAGLIVSGILLGLALSTKYLALFIGVIAVVEILLICFLRKKSASEILRSCTAYIIPALIFGGFWYVKNLILTGNPFFPIFAPGTSAEFTTEVNAFVLSRTWYNFFIFPFFIFGKSTYVLPFGIFTAVCFAATYLSFIFLAVKKRLTLFFMATFIALELYLGFVFIWSHQIRFIIPALILNTVALCLGVYGIISYFKENSLHASLSDKKRVWMKRIVSIIMIVIVALLGAASLVSFKTELTCISAQHRARCFEEIEGGAYYAVKYINENLEDTVVIEYFNVFYRYSMRNGNALTDQFCTDVRREEIAACLHTQGTLYYLDDTKSRNNPWVRDEEAKLRTASHFIQNGQLIFEYYEPGRDTYHRLYRLD